MIIIENTCTGRRVTNPEQRYFDSRTNSVKDEPGLLLKIKRKNGITLYLIKCKNF